MSQLFEKEKKQKLLIVDGMYLIFSSFYAFGNMRSASGFSTGALYGFITRIDYLLKELKPDFLVIALDSKGKTFRHEIYPEYKAKRKPAPEDLLIQIPEIKEYLKLKNIDTIEMPSYEGDDIIWFCKNEADKDMEVIIFTADKDMFQLVDRNTSIFHPKLKKTLDIEGIKEHYGLYPNQVVDYLSLMGDSSDNIPGAKGIGEKTAKKLIDQHGSIKNIFENIDNIEDKYRKKLEASRDDIILSKKLILLNTEKPENFTIHNKEYKNIVSRELALFYKKHSFRTMLSKIDSILKEQGQLNEIKHIIVKSKDQLIALKDEIINRGYFAFDLETTGLSFFNSTIIGISISFHEIGYYLPVKFPIENKNDIRIDLNLIKEILIPVFENKNIKKSGFNLKFDTLFLKNINIEVNGIVDDGMIASGLLYPNRRSHKLKDLTFEYLNISQNTFESIIGTGKETKPAESIDLKIIGEYCIDDSNTSLKLVDFFKPLIKENDLAYIYNTVEIPLLSVLMDMEFNGIKIDMDKLQIAIKKLETQLSDIEKEIISQAGYEFNINSSKQLGELLFEKMKLPMTKKTKKTKSYSTDIEVLTEFKSIPIIENIIKYRGWKKLYSTYLIGIKERVDPKTNKIHTSFNQTVTATGRLSSSNPNLQNIPVFETDGINIRKLFISDTNKRLLAADYSQIELRVMAHFSKDKQLCNAFNNNLDIHSQTAELVFGRDLFMDNKLKRKRAKIINFSIIYGSGPYSLSKELEVSFKESKEFIDTYFEKYSGVKAYIDDTIADAEKNGFVRTMSNRKRDLPEIQSSIQNIKENGKRMAVNTIIQGSAAEIMKKAMINIHKKIKNMESKMLLSVHDEIIFEYPINEETKLISIVSTEMKNVEKLSVPLEISVKTGANWGEMIEWEQK